MTQDEAERAWRRGYAYGWFEIAKLGDGPSPREALPKLYPFVADTADKLPRDDTRRVNIDPGKAEAACAQWNADHDLEIQDDLVDVLTPVKWAAALGMAEAVREAEEG